MHDALVARPIQARWWAAIATSVVLVGGCSDNKEEMDLLNLVHRTLPGVNVLPGTRTDSVYVALPNPSTTAATEFGRLGKELELPDLYTSMTSSQDGVDHTVTSECCIATWHWSSDDGFILNVRLRGAEATPTTTQAPTLT